MPVATVMNRSQLFVLKPDFLYTERGRCFCPGCAEVLGLLEYYPDLKAGIDLRIVDFPRPRPILVDLLGEENQSCPVLVLAAEADVDTTTGVVRHARGRCFVEGAEDIARYMAAVHGTGTRY